MVKHLAFLIFFVCRIAKNMNTLTSPPLVSPTAQPKTTVPRHTLEYCHPYPYSAPWAVDKTKYPLHCKSSLVCSCGGGGLTQAGQLSAQKGKASASLKFVAQ